MGKAAIFGERKVSRPRNMLTDRQAQVLLFMWEFYEANDQLPPCMFICAHFGWKSPNAVQTHVEALESKGWIERNTVGKYKFAPIARTAIAEAEAVHRAREAGTVLEPIPA